MKVNTDGVLLGALATADEPKSILDIGTGTGVIALMLAQRFENSLVDAVEIDGAAATTADGNFKASKFADRLRLFASGFEEHFKAHPGKQYDLIVTNPPFFLNSLTSPGATKNLARHADDAFFKLLILSVAKHLTPGGLSTMILPLETAAFVKILLPQVGLHLQEVISIKSFADSLPHREIISFGKLHSAINQKGFVIYGGPKVYSEEYQNALRAFLTIL